MATYSSIRVWRNPWAEDLGRLYLMESQTVHFHRLKTRNHTQKNVIYSQYDISFWCNSINNLRSYFFLEINKRIIIQLFTSVFLNCISLLLLHYI